MSNGHTADILEIKVKDASYRTFYKVTVRVSQKDKVQQIIKDLEHFGVNLAKISSRPKRFNLFDGGMVEEDKDCNQKGEAAEQIKNESIW